MKGTFIPLARIFDSVLRRRCEISGLVLLLALAGCKPRPADPVAAPAPQTYAVRGVVISVAPDLGHALIKHQAISNYMAAMTMNFPARDPSVLRGISPGDEITFTLAVTETNDWIENVRRVGQTNAYGLSGPPGWHIAEPELEVGDTLPDYEFTAENNRPIRFSDFRGRALAFTFFFTSCPLPDYCPRMNRNFAEARQLLATNSAGPTNWQFLSISFDSSFDTPQLLSAYAWSYRGKDTNRWLFAVASTNTLASLAPKVDLNIWRAGGTFSHNMRTVVLFPDPLGPRQPRISPQLKENETLLTAGTAV